MTPEEIEQKRQKEKDLFSLMIRFYCEKYHHTKAHEHLCEECAELEKYAHARVQRCPFIETKTFCSKCKSHCYNKEMRARVKEVMKSTGPRLLLHHPILVIKHALQ